VPFSVPQVAIRPSRVKHHSIAPSCSSECLTTPVFMRIYSHQYTSGCNSPTSVHQRMSEWRRWSIVGGVCFTELTLVDQMQIQSWELQKSGCSESSLKRGRGIRVFAIGQSESTSRFERRRLRPGLWLRCSAVKRSISTVYRQYGADEDHRRNLRINKPGRSRVFRNGLLTRLDRRRTRCHRPRFSDFPSTLTSAAPRLDFALIDES